MKFINYSSNSGACGLFFIVITSIHCFVLNDWKEIETGLASKEILDFNTQISKTATYSCSVSYKTFKGHYTNEVYQQNSGYIIRDGDCNYTQVLEKTTIQNKQLRVVIDSAQKTLTITNPLKGVEANFNGTDYIKILGMCKSVKKKTEGEMTGYRFEMKNSRGTVAQEFFFDSNFIRRLTYYYANEHSLRENNTFKEEIVYPKATIEFSNFKRLAEIRKEQFGTDHIVKLKKGKLTPAALFKDFKIIDGRYYK